MSLIDERGRLFGRVNLIDALVALVALGLIPLAYGAFLMFRVPAAKITALSPAEVPAGVETVVRITGEDLRPFLHVQLGPYSAKGFYLRSPTDGEMRTPALPAGTYDLTASDETREVLRMPGALTVVAPAEPPQRTTEVQVVGAFVGLSAVDARAIAIGARFEAQKGAPPAGEVLAVGAPGAATQRVKFGATFLSVPLPGQVRVPAVLRLRCVVVGGECQVGDAKVSEDATLTLPAAGTVPQLRFLVHEVRPPDARVTVPPAQFAIATLRVRFVVGPEVLDVMKAGDVDVPGAGVVAEAERAVLTQIGSERQAASVQVVTEGLLRRGLYVQQTLLAVTGTVRVPVVHGRTGWTYKDRPVKGGAAFNFETAAGAMAGWILDVSVSSER